jgi:hypothetical protein
MGTMRGRTSDEEYMWERPRRVDDSWIGVASSSSYPRTEGSGLQMSMTRPLSGGESGSVCAWVGERRGKENMMGEEWATDRRRGRIRVNVDGG